MLCACCLAACQLRGLGASWRHVGGAQNKSQEFAPLGNWATLTPLFQQTGLASVRSRAATALPRRIAGAANCHAKQQDRRSDPGRMAQSKGERQGPEGKYL